MRSLVKISFLALSLILFLYLGCKSPNGPESMLPGRRDYTWTVDTISSYDPVYRLWGYSPTNVWAVTRAGYDNKKIFHFDGERWITGNYVVPFGIYSIYGFSDNNIFLGCNNGKIYHFDGNSFSEVAALTKDGRSDIVFDNMWGESPNDLYAFGAYPDANGPFNNSVIAHFTNNRWDMFNTAGLIGIVEHLYKNQTDNKIYLQVIKISNTYDSTAIYEYWGDQYTKLYNTQWDNHWASISLINNEVYFILKDEIDRRVNNQFQMVLNLGSTNFYENIWGRNLKDLFLEMENGLAHYNGSDIQYLFHYIQPNVSIFGAVLFENDVFFLVYEYTTRLSLIYHGKLK